MRTRSRILSIVPALALGAALAAPMTYAASPAPSKTSTGTDRLFLAFAEDAAFAPSQWWEGQLDYTDNDHFNATILRLVAAFQPVRNLELGGRVGFGTTSAETGFPDGSGATDLDLYGKWNLGTIGGRTSFAVGGLVSVPTGDESSWLGNDAFGLEAFGAVRHALDNFAVSAHAGVRLNGNGHDPFKNRLDGKVSANLGVGFLFPVADQVSLLGEVNVETERFNNPFPAFPVAATDSDARVLFGVNWRPLQTGVVRGAVAAGLTDGAPNFQLLVGYAYTF